MLRILGGHNSPKDINPHPGPISEKKGEKKKKGGKEKKKKNSCGPHKKKKKKGQTMNWKKGWVGGFKKEKAFFFGKGGGRKKLAKKKGKENVMPVSEALGFLSQKRGGENKVRNRDGGILLLGNKGKEVVA